MSKMQCISEVMQFAEARSFEGLGINIITFSSSNLHRLDKREWGLLQRQLEL